MRWLVRFAIVLGAMFWLARCVAVEMSAAGSL